MSTTGPNRPIAVLLVEDNPGDVRLMQEALQEGKIPVQVAVVEDGDRAMEFLRQQGDFATAVRPDLVLLDLNLPRKDGREVLAEIKLDKDLRMIPVVVMTNSRAAEDIIKSYTLQANCYIVKPANADQFVEVVRSLENFWCSIATLPHQNG
jgi:chemotaxis family two-component system response regulator Rcp1